MKCIKCLYSVNVFASIIEPRPSSPILSYRSVLYALHNVSEAKVYLKPHFNHEPPSSQSLLSASNGNKAGERTRSHAKGHQCRRFSLSSGAFPCPGCVFQAQRHHFFWGELIRRQFSVKMYPPKQSTVEALFPRRVLCEKMTPKWKEVTAAARIASQKIRWSLLLWTKISLELISLLLQLLILRYELPGCKPAKEVLWKLLAKLQGGFTQTWCINLLHTGMRSTVCTPADCFSLSHNLND